MNGFWGADAEALRTMGAVCARRAELLDELEGRLSAVIETVEWVGEDAERFRADWSGSVRPGLQDRGLELRQQARRLAQHAEEQEAASSPDSSGGPWSSPGEFLADMARMAQGMLRDLLGGGSGPAGRFADMLREALATPEGRAALLGAFLGSLLGGLLADLVLRGLALGMLLEELLDAGALDAWLVPISMKHGRPAVTIHALVREGSEGPAAALLMDRTGTLGVRMHRVERIIRTREFTEVEVRGQRIAVKIARDQDGAVVRREPEFRDVAAAARVLGISERTMLDLAKEAASGLSTS